MLANLVVVALGSFIFGTLRARLIHFEDVLPLVGASNTATNRCKLCTTQELLEANYLAGAFYGRDSIPDEIVQQWWLKNPSMFACVVDAGGSIEASFGIMPLVDNFLDQFIAGKVVESQIGPEDICGISEAKRQSRLYISGVVVRDPGTPRGHLRVGILVWAMILYLRKRYGFQKKRTIYALAATKAGEELLCHLSFKLISSANHRLDEHNLYSLELSKATLNKIEHFIPDYRPMCVVQLEDKVEGTPTFVNRS